MWHHRKFIEGGSPVATNHSMLFMEIVDEHLHGRCWTFLAWCSVICECTLWLRQKYNVRSISYLSSKHQSWKIYHLLGQRHGGFLQITMLMYVPTSLKEYNALRQLSQRGINVDHNFTMQFCNKTHQSDGRPLAYKGKVLFDISTKFRDMFWKRSEILTDGITEPVPQLAAKDMDIMEDMAKMPQIIDDIGVRGAKKWEQIGTAGVAVLVRSLLKGADLSNKDGLILPVPNLVVGQEYRAFLELRRTSELPMHYVTMTDSDANAEWLLKTEQDNLTQEFATGKLVIPGVKPAQLELPSDMAVQLPTPPQLNVLTLAKKAGDVVGCKAPEHMCNAWKDHARFGGDFEETPLVE